MRIGRWITRWFPCFVGKTEEQLRTEAQLVVWKEYSTRQNLLRLALEAECIRVALGAASSRETHNEKREWFINEVARMLNELGAPKIIAPNDLIEAFREELDKSTDYKWMSDILAWAWNERLARYMTRRDEQADDAVNSFLEQFAASLGCSVQRSPFGHTTNIQGKYGVMSFYNSPRYSS